MSHVMTMIYLNLMFRIKFIYLCLSDNVDVRELLGTVSLKERTHGQNITKAMMAVAAEHNLPL